MAARKTRPVLYEMFRPPAKSSEPARKPQISTPAPAPDHPAQTTGETETHGPVKSVAALLPGASAIVQGRQITVSVSTLAIVIALFIVLLAVAFSAGRKYEAFQTGTSGETELVSGEQDGGDDSSPHEASDVTYDASASDESDQRTSSDSASSDQRTTGTDESSTTPAAAKPPHVTLRKGFHYVVVQHFSKRREQQAALDAARFLRENGVECATLTGADIRVVAIEPFLIKQADGAAKRQEQRRADELMRRIRDLGKEYNKRLAKDGKRGYTFAECYLHEMK